MTTGHSNSVVFRGARVVSADGKALGTVKDARQDRFLVDVRWAPDYWLGIESVEDSTQEQVQLSVKKEALAGAKLHLDVAGPGLN